jgi:hypothetical protein
VGIMAGFAVLGGAGPAPVRQRAAELEERVAGVLEGWEECLI